MIEISVVDCLFLRSSVIRVLIFLMCTEIQGIIACWNLFGTKYKLRVILYKFYVRTDPEVFERKSETMNS